MRTKSWRRNQSKIKEMKAFKKFLDHPYYMGSSVTKDEYIEKAKNDARILKDNMKPCSCWMCRNIKEDKPVYISKKKFDDKEIDLFFNKINRKDA